MSSRQLIAPERPDEILQAIERLDNPDLETVARRTLEIQAERRAPHLSARETELLSQINTGASDETWERYNNLKRKRDSGSLATAEHQEIADLYDVIELLHARRISAVVELAQLRKQPVEEVMDSLGLVSPGCE